MSNLIGQSLGRYHILEQLGEGGMATVYKARDVNLDRDVAVKVIRAENFGSAILERILKRFEREAKSLARLTHPNIVPILDYGEYNGAPYLVMPYLPGGTLKGRLKGPIPYREAVQMLIPIAQALVHAHGQGIIHRDIKPSNILITRTGEPMLSDFGIAKILDTEETRDLTSTGVGIGTPEYMAPEQGLGQADERTDIYALGIVLYEMITGRIPFRADTPMAILLKKNQEPLPRPSRFVPGLPSSVENVLIKALARDPDNRYQTMRELLNALGRLWRDESVTVEMPREKKNYSMWILAGIGGLIVLAVCGIGLFAVGKLLASDSPPTEPATLVTQAVPVNPIFTSPPAWTESPIPPPIIDPTLTPDPVPGQTSINPQDQAEIVYIPASTFEMGLTNAQAKVIRATCNQCDDELAASQPRHTVTLDAYWIYKYEVSNATYQQCAQAGFCSPPAKFGSDKITNYYNNPIYANYPVAFITWNAAETYCQWAGGHLPTDAQWEYAARGPNGNLYPWGDQSPSLSLANLADYIGDTQPVDAYPSGVSYFGLYNMTGNIWEWVFDWYRADYYQTNTNWINPTGPTSGDIKSEDSLKTGRGGAYWISPGGSSAGLRDWYQVSKTGSAVGFRCAMNP